MEFTTEREVARAIAFGRLRTDTPVRLVEADGVARWRLASEVAELRPLLGLEPGPEPEPALMPEPETPAPQETPSPRRGIFDRRVPDVARPDEQNGPAPAAPPRVRRRADDFDAMMALPLRRYADFSGRSRRKEFWTFYGTQFAIYWFFVGFGNDGTRAGITITGLIALFLLLPNLALLVRRLHDRDLSGWVALLLLIPWVGWIVLLILALFDGVPGRNRYGENPKA